MERLLPGFEADLLAAGAHHVDLPTDMRWLTPAGTWVHPFRPTARLLPASRPPVESAIRARVRRLAGVTILDRHEVTGLRRGGGSLAGVSVRTRDSQESAALDADLVVDASGRSSALPRWLAPLGVARPR